MAVPDFLPLLTNDDTRVNTDDPLPTPLNSKAIELDGVTYEFESTVYSSYASVDFTYFLVCPLVLYIGRWLHG